MSSEVTDAALAYLARQLDELAADFPTSPDDVDLVTLTDDVNMLAHHLQQAAERAQNRFTTPAAVHSPERLTLVRLSRAATGIAKALEILTEALTYATTAFQRQALPDLSRSYLHNDPQILRIMTAEKYVAARARLRHTAADLRTAAPARSTAPQTRPAAVPRTRQRTRP
jgi:hypothetical protein